MDNKSTNKGEKKALIIAISDYDNLPREKQLPFCRNDGEKVYEVLQEQGYKIPDDWKLIGRVTSDRLKKAIFDFFRKQSQPKDTLLFYFSGHGIPDGHGGHYLASSDIETEYPDYNGFRFSELEDQANKSAAKKIIRILDCCFSGAAEVKGSEEDVARSARSAMDRTFKEGDGKCVLASSLADQVSYKKRGEDYSLFTYCVLEGLKGGKEGGAINLEGYVTPHTLANYVYDKIMEEDRRQKPITKTEMSGDIVLAYYPQLIKRQENELAPTTSASSTPNSPSQSNETLRSLLELARDYYVKGEYKKADISFENVLAIQPNNIEALNSRGISLYRLEEYNEAKKCFEKVLELDPKNLVALNNITGLDKKIAGSRQQIERPSEPPSSDNDSMLRADPRNPYNDPTLPYYHPNLHKKNAEGTQYGQKPNYWVSQEQADKTVYISYAKEDSTEAERLYKDLKNAGAKPWIDKEEIRAGMHWELAISKAIKNNRFFIPLFSSKSVSNVGYVNKELKYALDALEKYPEKDIYIIPVRLDDCETPLRLEDIQFADLFPDWDAGVRQILKSMKIEIQQEKEKQQQQQEGEEKWIMGMSETLWKSLLNDVYQKKCIPFIGPGMYKVRNKDGRPLIPLSIVDRLKGSTSYPLEVLNELARIYILEDSDQLARLSQFLAIEQAAGNEIAPKILLSQMIKEIDASKFSSERSKSPYDVLADLDLPIYVTTNYDHFLEEALSRNKRKQPQSDFFRWSDELMRYFKALEVPSVFDDTQYKPTEERPLVYHIHGDIEYPKSMVLTETDYFDFVTNTNRRENPDVYPSILQRVLATSSILFVGYTLEEISFRTIFQGFLAFLDSTVGRNRKTTIAVLMPPQTSSKAQARMRQRYMEQYIRNLYPSMHIFWGDTSEFIRELEKGLKEFKGRNGHVNPTSTEVP